MRGGRPGGRRSFKAEEGLELLYQRVVLNPFLLYSVSFILVIWAIERWVISFSNWLPLAFAVWATVQYGNYQRHILTEDLTKKWNRIILENSSITTVEHCEWLNKLLMEVWSSYMNPKLSIRFSSIIESYLSENSSFEYKIFNFFGAEKLKHRKSRLVERIELLEFSLGSHPPILGLHGTRWSTCGNQKIMRLNFDWDTKEMSILLQAKLGRPFIGTARIVINSLQIKGDLLLRPILDGKAILYSFVSTPDVRIGVAFGSGGSQSLPATELPGVSSLLVKTFTNTLVKTMVEPRRRCFSLPAVDLRKTVVGGVIYVTVVSASNLSRNELRRSPSKQHTNSLNGTPEEQFTKKNLETFVEVELGDLSRRTGMRSGSSPVWDSTFNMILHEETEILRFHLYESNSNYVKYDYLTSCEIKVKYVADDSMTIWAIANDSSVIAKQAECYGKEIEIVVPFEGVSCGELTVRLALKEWQFSGGSYGLNRLRLSSEQFLYGSSNFLPRTGRKINITVVEGKDLIVKDRSGKSDLYVKMQYGKVLQKTKTAQSNNPIWNQIFEFDEIGGGEYLKIKCHSEDVFYDDTIGSARVNLEGLIDGLIRDVWIPLEKVNSGELRLQIEAIRADDKEGSMASGNGWIELVLIEAKDLVAADLRGTSDPYVKVHYGSLKKRTKVVYKTLNPHWNQTLEFADDGRPLVLYVKDHNALLPTSSIGNCTVEYHSLPLNQMSDEWIHLRGVKSGEIHVQITRKVHEVDAQLGLESRLSITTKAHQISGQMKQTIKRFRTLIEDNNEELSTALTELEGSEEMQREYMLQLETEQMLLLNKMKEIGEEIFNSCPSLSTKSSPN